MNGTTLNPSLQETNPALIRAELERLLADRHFSGARQMSAFLRYIVTETLDGNAERIKAYTVGVDALGKPHDFDAQSDPSVRVLALRLRKTLAAVYEDCPVCHARIALTVGCYVPEFYQRDAPWPLPSVSGRRQPEHVPVAVKTTDQLMAPATGGRARQEVRNHSGASAANEPVSCTASASVQSSVQPSVQRGNSQSAEPGTLRLADRWVLVVGGILLATALQFAMNSAGASNDSLHTDDGLQSQSVAADCSVS
jgi:hypothetical protein